MHRLNNDTPSALRELAEGLKAVPKDVELHADRVAIFQAEKRCADAVEDLRALARLQPKETSWAQELGRCLTESGRVEEGLRVY
ncbi:MAG: hypothetical protein FD126_3654, partial [Elusimicrobia bacterium]